MIAMWKSSAELEAEALKLARERAKGRITREVKGARERREKRRRAAERAARRKERNA
jgi:hypothetical protein